MPLYEKTSIFTGRKAKMEIPATPEEIEAWQKSGRPIQEFFPNMTPDQRQFLLSGSTPQEWDELFAEDAPLNPELTRKFVQAHTTGTKKE